MRPPAVARIPPGPTDVDTDEGSTATATVLEGGFGAVVEGIIVVGTVVVGGTVVAGMVVVEGGIVVVVEAEGKLVVVVDDVEVVVDEVADVVPGGGGDGDLPPRTASTSAMSPDTT